MLIVVYYALDNRPIWFRSVFRAVDIARRVVSRLPFPLIRLLTLLGAAFIYYPLARISLMLEKLGIDPSYIPLSSYRHRTFYTMRNDALNRFGNRIEHRFTREQVRELMTTAGLESVVVSDKPPYWSAVGYRKAG
jgi:hypothetical protein